MCPTMMVSLLSSDGMIQP